MMTNTISVAVNALASLETAAKDNRTARFTASYPRELADLFLHIADDGEEGNQVCHADGAIHVHGESTTFGQWTAIISRKDLEGA